MATTVYIPVEEYLHTSYRPDCDYIDGEVQERNLGTKSHGLLQGLLVQWFNERFDTFGCTAIPEQRVQVSATRFRIPDVCVVLDDNLDEAIMHTAPLLCIEVLSPEDRLPQVQQRVNDYVRMGVPNIWVLDPVTHDAWTADGTALRPSAATELSVLGTEMVLDLAHIFSELERRLKRQRR